MGPVSATCVMWGCNWCIYALFLRQINLINQTVRSCFAESHLQRHHLHQDGKVGEVVAEAHGVVEVPTLTHTALVRPNPSSIAGKHKNQDVTSVSTCSAHSPPAHPSCPGHSGWLGTGCSVPSLSLLSLHPWGSSCSSGGLAGQDVSSGLGAGQDPQALFLFLGSSLSSDPRDFAFSGSQEKPEFPVLSQPWSGVGAQKAQAPHGHHRSPSPGWQELVISADVSWVLQSDEWSVLLPELVLRTGITSPHTAALQDILEFSERVCCRSETKLTTTHQGMKPSWHQWSSAGGHILDFSLYPSKAPRAPAPLENSTGTMPQPDSFASLKSALIYPNLWVTITTSYCQQLGQCNPCETKLQWNNSCDLPKCRMCRRDQHPH